MLSIIQNGRALRISTWLLMFVMVWPSVPWTACGCQNAAAPDGRNQSFDASSCCCRARLPACCRSHRDVAEPACCARSGNRTRPHTCSCNAGCMCKTSGPQPAPPASCATEQESGRDRTLDGPRDMKVNLDSSAGRFLGATHIPEAPAPVRSALGRCIGLGKLCC